MSFQIFAPDLMHPVKGILFDMDGLILDTEKLYSRFWQEACISLGYPMTREQALTMRALNSQAGEANLKRFFGPDIDYQQVRSCRIRRMDAYIEEHGVDPKPGAQELLAYLNQKNIPAALASSSPRERIAAYLTPLGLYSFFRVICSGHEVPHGKPEPDIFLHAAAQLDLDPKNCMVLEDSPAGILSAHRAGCMPMMIPDLDGPDEETKKLLYAQGDSLLDVIDLLEKA